VRLTQSGTVAADWRLGVPQEGSPRVQLGRMPLLVGVAASYLPSFATLTGGRGSRAAEVRRPPRGTGHSRGGHIGTGNADTHRPRDGEGYGELFKLESIGSPSWNPKLDHLWD